MEVGVGVEEVMSRDCARLWPYVKYCAGGSVEDDTTAATGVLT